MKGNVSCTSELDPRRTVSLQHLTNKPLLPQCGGNFNLLGGIYSCNTRYPGTVTFSRATDPSDPGHHKYFYGIDMHFWLQWPWAESDADHKCISKAVEQASCGKAGVKSYSGKWCRNTDWRPQPPLLEWSNDMGPP